MLVKEVENPLQTVRSVQVMSRTGGPALKQTTFDWKGRGNRHFHSYNIQDNREVPVKLNWIGKEGLIFANIKCWRARKVQDQCRAGENVE